MNNIRGQARTKIYYYFAAIHAYVTTNL